jgi:Tfp pilus assembly protein PilF
MSLPSAARTRRPRWRRSFAAAGALLLALGGAARADKLTVADHEPIVGEVVAQDGVAMRIRANGWVVTVPTDRVLARAYPGGRIDLPAADALEDQALQHESRGRHGPALEAYTQALSRVLAAAAAGAPTPLVQARLEVYLRRAHFFVGELGRPGEGVELFTRLAEDERAPALARDWARTYRGEHLRALGRLDMAADEEAGLGVVSAWFVAGPFDNERGTGFGRAFDPESTPFDPAATFEGKKTTVGWRALPFADLPRGQVELDSLMRPADQGVAYAIAFLHAEAATPVALRLGSDEAVALWVNRKEVLRHDARRPYRPDQQAVGVVLSAGWNEVLVKVADQTGDWRFRLRVSAQNGGPAAGVRQATPPEVAATPARAPAEVAPCALAPDGVTALEAITKAAPDDWRAQLHLGYLRWALQAHDQGQHPDREALLAACALRPDLAHLRVFLSHASSTPAEFSVNKEENPRRQALEEALRLDPGHVEARLLLAQYYAYDLGSIERARELLLPALAAEPDHLDAKLLLLDIDERRGLGPLVADRIGLLMAEAGARITTGEAENYPQALVRRALGLASKREDAAAQLELYEKLVGPDQDDTGALVAQARLYRAGGHDDTAEMLLRRALRVDPYHNGVRRELASWLEAKGELPRAEELLEEALALCPDDEGLVEALAHVNERLGHQEEAEVLFERALQLDPNLVDLREYLEYRARHEQGAAPFEAAWTIDAAPLVKAAAQVPLDARQTHRYLLRQTVTRVNQDGTTSEFTQEVLRVENENGARALAAYSATYGSEQRIKFQAARVHRKGGGVEEVPVGSSRGRQAGEFSQYLRFSVRFPPLEPGDAIEVRYRTDDLEQGFFGDYYGHVAYFGGEQAIDRARYVLIAPKGRRFYVHTKGMPAAVAAVKPTIDEAAGTQTYVFEHEGMAPLESEPNQPWWKELLPQVQVSTFQDWDSFAAWYWNLVKGQHEADDAIRAKVRELCEGATTPEERIRRVYHYVVSEIRYNASWEFGIHGFKPYNATQIYARKFGDCKDKATLINTMLREVGIESYPVLIFGEDARGVEDISLPLMGHFNHCISWVDFGQGGLFLDGTAEHHAFPNLPSMDYGAKVVVVSPQGGSVKEIPYRGPEQNAIREEHRVRLTEDGKGELTSVIEGTGSFDSVLRGWLLTEGRRKEVLEPAIGRAYTGAHVKAVRTSDVRDLETPLRVEIDVEVPKILGQATGNSLELLEVRSWLFDRMVLGGRSISGLAADAQRERDVVLGVPAGVEETVTYELPAGHSVQSVPQPVELESAFGVYKRVYSLEAGVLRVKRVLQLSSDRISVEQYEQFRAWVGQIERAEGERPMLRRGGASQ